MSDQPQWMWDPDSKQYYFYDSRSDTLNFQNGRRVARPPSIPRTTFTSASSQAAAIPSSSSYAPNPVPPNPGYVTTPSGQQYQTQRGSYPATTPSYSASFPAQAQYGQQPRPRAPPSQVDALAQNLAQVTVSTQQPYPGPSQHPQPVTPHVREQDGQRFVETSDPRAQLRTIVQTAPVTAITDPDLLQRGIQATRRVFPSDNEPFERLFKAFRQRESPRKFFTVGKVFLVLWVEPAGESNTQVTNLEPGTTIGRFGERVFSKVRRFVVVREGDSYCSALPITSYGHRGVGKPGVTKSEHSIIHTTKKAPDPLPAELPARDEEGMRPHAIRVDPDDPVEKLDNQSRLDYGKVHTIQHNIKVKAFGKVNPNSMHALINQFGNVWRSVPAMGQPSSSRSTVDVEQPSHAKRQIPPPARRPSQSSGFSSGGGPVPTAQMRQPGSQPSIVERVPSQEDRDVAVQAHIRSEIQRLMQRGYTQQEAEQAIRNEAQRRAQQAPAPRRPQQQESSSDDDDDDEDDDDDDNDAVPARRNNQQPAGDQRREEAHRREEAPRRQAGSSQSASRPALASQASQRSAPQAQASAGAQFRSSASTQQSSSRTPAASQSSASRTTGQSRAPSMSAAAPSSSQAHIAAQNRAQAEALMARLLSEGKSREEAAAIIRARFGSGRSS